MLLFLQSQTQWNNVGIPINNIIKPTVINPIRMIVIIYSNVVYLYMRTKRIYKKRQWGGEFSELSYPGNSCNIYASTFPSKFNKLLISSNK